MDIYHLKPIMELLTKLLLVSYNEKIATEFYAFWDYFLSQKYLNPKKPKKILMQHFSLEYKFGSVKEIMLINIEEIAKNISDNTIAFEREKYSNKDYYYTDMRKSFLFNKPLFNKKKHKYPVIAIFFPAVSPQQTLRMNCIIEGNHRVTNATIKNETIDVIRINTILVPLNVFNRTRDWLLYVMIANFYEIIHKNNEITSYEQIENYLSKNLNK